MEVCAEEPPWGYRQIAREYGIPPERFYAVALQESRAKLRSGKVRPWPWTLSIDKAPHYFRTRRAAWRALKLALEDRVHQLGVGLMQIEWRYHKDKLIDPWQALEPYHNLRVGAGYLRDCYWRTGDWDRAVGCYHSPGETPAQRRRAKQYSKQVSRQLAALERGENG